MSEPLTHQAYLARNYLPELDGMRALSVLIVVSVHMHDKPMLWHWLGGWQGVTVFFVLSGYLITTLALREEAERGWLSLKAFYIRRSFRIFPLYYFTLALYCFLIFTPLPGLSGFVKEKVQPLKEALPWYLLYMQEVPHFYGVDITQEDGTVTHTHTNIPFYQSWSLGIEEKFYLVWPLLIFVWLRGQPRGRYWVTVLLVVFFALLRPLFSPLQEEAGMRELAECLAPYYSIIIGCLLALMMNEKHWYERMRFLGTPLWTNLVLALFLFLHFARPEIPEQQQLGKLLGYLCDTFYIIVTTILLACVLMGEGWLQKALRWQPLVFIGKLSYGIYLIHILCLGVAQAVIWKIFGTGKFAQPDDYYNKLVPWQRLIDLGDMLANRPLAVLASVLAFVAACAMAIGAAWVLNHLIEKPCITMGRKWSKKVLTETRVLVPKTT